MFRQLFRYSFHPQNSTNYLDIQFIPKTEYFFVGFIIWYFYAHIFRSLSQDPFYSESEAINISMVECDSEVGIKMFVSGQINQTEGINATNAILYYILTWIKICVFIESLIKKLANGTTQASIKGIFIW